MGHNAIAAVSESPAAGPGDTSERALVVGAGILGLSVARALQRRRPSAEVVVLEKEPALGMHQTGRNSGVVHAGIYYTPGSLKARLCVDGMRRLRDYCRSRGIPYEECGKLVVASDAAEEPRLRALFDRAVANGVEGVALLGPAGIREVEPHVVGRLALHSPRTAIVDFARVAHSLAADVRAAGGEVRLSTRVLGIEQRDGGVEVATAGGTLRAGLLVNCGGLQADRLAQASGDTAGPRIVPFRGAYYRLAPQRRGLVRGLVYPVPDPAYPFLGVHLTRRVDGEVLVGPNAVLALARERYGPWSVAPGDVAATLRWPGFWALARRHWRAGAAEVARSLSRRRFAAQARRYVPELRARDLVRADAGIRAQAVDADGQLVDDFRVTRLGAVVNVRNAPSPAATSSLAIAEHIVAQLKLP